MEGYEITTAHNVKLKLGYASLGDRLLAFVIDSLIKTGYVLALVFIGIMITRSVHTDSGPSIAFWVFAIIIGLLPYLFYSLFFEYFMEGQTPGKRVRKIKVASQDSSELTFGQCMIRWLFRLVDFGVFSGAIAMVTIAVTDRKQRVGDLVAGTIVVSLKTEKTLEQTIYAYVAPDRAVRYPLAARLTAREIEVIKEVIRLNNEEGKYDLIPMTATRVRATVGAGVETDDLSLLQTVIEDYYTLAAQ